MFIHRSYILFILTITLAVLTNACSRPEPADLVLMGGNVVTVNEAQPRAQAVAIRGDSIVAVGSDSDMLPYVTGDTRVLQMEGKTIVPGMIDAHVHFINLGKRLLQINAWGQSKEDIINMVSERVSKAKPGEWIQGRGWDQNLWTVKEFPTKEDIDKVAPDNPVFLKRVDAHAGWVNTQALRIAGITRRTRDPKGGQIIHDRRGNPTGTLIDNAFRLVESKIPPLTRAELRKSVELAIQEGLASGLTGVHDAGSTREEVEVYEEMMKEDNFDFRLFSFLRWPANEEKLPHTYEDLDYYLEKGPQVGLYDNRLTIRGIKMSVDGALGSRGAALLEPYTDDPKNKGLFRLTHEEVKETIVRGLRAGYQTTTHAIGDHANRMVLDAMEEAIKETGVVDHRMRIEHAQILHPDDLPRFAQLGITPSMQPTHCTTDMHWAATRLGEDRTKFAYAWRTLLDSGARIAGGSDAPVEPVQPLPGIFAAITRQDVNHTPEGGWHPKQLVTREEALRMFTIDAAYSVFEEDIKGSLEAGKLADIAVLSKDIMTVPAKEVLETEVLMTILGGKVVYEKGKSPVSME